MEGVRSQHIVQHPQRTNEIMEEKRRTKLGSEEMPQLGKCVLCTHFQSLAPM